jgi:site-specific DNA recombinase
VLTAPDPAQAFREASLMAQRAVIDALCTVRLRLSGKARLKRDHTGREVINPATVVIDWKR